MDTSGHEGGRVVLSVVNALKCPNCKDIIFSRAHHDYHACSCGAITIDGGSSYLRFGWDGRRAQREDIEHLKLELNISKSEMYDDWNKQINKYGTITEKKLKSKKGVDYVCQINRSGEQTGA